MRAALRITAILLALVTAPACQRVDTPEPVASAQTATTEALQSTPTDPQGEAEVALAQLRAAMSVAGSSEERAEATTRARLAIAELRNPAQRLAARDALMSILTVETQTQPMPH